MRLLNRQPLLAASILALGLSCAAGPYTQQDGRMLEVITRADTSIRPHAADLQVARVLNDILLRSYSFGHETRTAALRFVSHHPTVGLVPLVEQIAQLEIDRDDEGRQTFDTIAVADALRALTRMNHVTAVERNQARLSTDELLVFAAAVHNLQKLEDWSSTPRIQASLGEMALNLDEVVAIRNVLLFLQHSPSTSSEVCESFERIQDHAPMFRTGPVFFQDIPELVGSLQTRLACRTS